MTGHHEEVKTFLMKAYLLEVEVVNTRIIMAIVGVKVRNNEIIKLNDLRHWTPTNMDGWDCHQWRKLCDEIYKIKMLSSIKQEPV